MKRFLHIAVWLALFGLVGCAAPPGDDGAQPLSKTLEGPLDTVSTVTLYGGAGDAETIDEIFAMIRDIDARMSAVSDDSEIAAISAGAGTPARVSPDTFDLIRYAKTVGAETGGAFDVTIRPVAELWGIGTENARVPARAELDAALRRVGYEGIWLNEADRSVALAGEGMKLDLGGIAKGYACDRAAEILKSANAARGIIDLGGNVYACGTRPDGTPWRVGVKSPLLGENGYFCIVEAIDKAVVTSGVYERFFESDGRRYHHIMNPETGMPVDNGLISVTVIGESSTRADALSTACFVLGVQRGAAYLGTLPGVEGIFVTDDLRVWITPGLEDSVRVTDERFRPVS